jgi:small-conductance mechanosensitive channel
MEILAREILGNTVQDWLIALLAAVVSLACFYLFKAYVISRIVALAKQTKGEWDDALADLLARTSGLFLFLVALFVGSLFLSLPGTAHQGIFRAAMIALLIQGGLWLNGLIIFWLSRDIQRRREQDPASVTTINAMGFIGRLALWVVVLLLVLDNLGIDVTALIAGLGIGGIAVALAVQNIFGDLFASLSIVLDKPFTVGDFLIIGDFMGSVEYVGLKTTRLRSLSGEQLIFSNADLLGSRIRNYGRMFERRVVFALGVTYQTPRDKLVRIPTIIRETVEEQDKVRFDRAHFKGYGNFSLDFETVYYVQAPDYNLYMDIQQAINLRIHEHFEREGIEFAYPTQTLFVVSESPDSARQ